MTRPYFIMKLILEEGLKLIAVNPNTLKYEECVVVEKWSEGEDLEGPRCEFGDGKITDVGLMYIDAEKSSELNPIPIMLIAMGGKNNGRKRT